MSALAFDLMMWARVLRDARSSEYAWHHAAIRCRAIAAAIIAGGEL